MTTIQEQRQYIMATIAKDLNVRHLEARTRARVQRARIYEVEPGTYYQARSQSDPGTVHHLHRGPAGFTCTCPGATYTGMCYHLGALGRRFERESRVLRIAPKGVTS